MLRIHAFSEHSNLSHFLYHSDTYEFSRIYASLSNTNAIESAPRDAKNSYTDTRSLISPRSSANTPIRVTLLAGRS